MPIDAYHPPLDVQVRLQSSGHTDKIEPSNIDSSRDWNFKKCYQTQLLNLLSEASWGTVICSNDVRTSTQNFYNVVYSLFDTCVPKKRRNNKVTRRYPTWFTYDIIKDRQTKVRLHSKWKRTKSEQCYKLFSDLRSSLKTRISVGHELYIRRVENNLNKNPKEFWRHITNLRSKGGFEPNITYKGKTHSGVAAAEAFSEYFASVFQTDIPNLSIENVMNTCNSNSHNYINIFHFSDYDVGSGINNLKLNSSVGPDNIPPWVLKQGKKLIIHPLKHIFNLALKNGEYPPQWKLSRVTPIPKTSRKSFVDEYRPVAILSSLANIFENVLHADIYRQV